MQALGWEASTYRLKQIYRINSDIAYASGRYREQEALIEFAPIWIYDAVMDSNTRPEHAELNGKALRADDPFWQYFYPPNGYACRCTVRAMTQDRFDRKNIPLESSTGKLKTVKVDVSGETYNTHAYKGIKVDVGWDNKPTSQIKGKK